MESFAWLAAAPLAAVIVLLFGRLPSLRRAAFDRFARRVDLPVPPGLTTRLEGLVAARNMATGLGGIIGLALVATWGLLAGSPLTEEPIWIAVLMAGGLTGAAFGAVAIAAGQWVRRPTAEAPRLARATAAELSDYISPFELQGGRVVALLPVLLVAAAAAAGAMSDAVAVDVVLSAGPVAAAILALVVLAASEAAGRRVIARPQSASSDVELAWSDALRARVLRDIVSVPINIGTYVTFGVLFRIDEAVRGGILQAATAAAVQLLFMALVVLAVVSVAGKPQRHFRRRLWSGMEAAAADGRTP